VPVEPYYRRDLARVHHEGFSFHASKVAPGVISILAPVRETGGLVVEFGCGSGLLTAELVAAGFRVVATDASPAMIDLARQVVPDAEAHLVVALPDDALPEGDAFVGVGHPISYLPSLDAIHEALVAMADALRPGGILAFDVCDFSYAEARVDDLSSRGWVDDDWALITQFSLPARDQFVREMTIFTRNDDGTWRRDEERHDNVLLDVATIPPLLAEHGVDAEVRDAFGTERLPPGLKVIVGRKVR
jgi:SAM-dependent methyltransferase